MLLDAVINIHTDHKNILHLGDLSQRRLRWISYIDEYGPTLHYIKGPTYIIANTFSWMLMQEPPPLAMVGKDNTPYSNRTGCRPTGEPATMPGLNAESLECHFSWTDDREMSGCFQHLPAKECYLNIPEDTAIDNLLDMEAIKEQHKADQELH